MRRRKGPGITYDIVIALMGVVSFLFAYIGISMANLVFHLGLKPDAINVVSVGIFILISWYGLGIIINHRAVGPMGAVKRHFSIVANGDYYLKFKLRRGDDLKYISGHLNNMTARLMRAELSSIKRLEKIKSELQNILQNSNNNSEKLHQGLGEFLTSFKKVNNLK